MGRGLHWLTRLFPSDPSDGEPVDMLRGGAPLWLEAFAMEEADARRLGSALAALAQAFPSRVAPRLERAIAVERWPQSRASVNALRAEGTRAMWAAPTVAAWLRLGHPVCPRDDAYAGYGLRESCFALADWRTQATQQRDRTGLATDAALATLERFMDEHVEPLMLEILAAPTWLVHRGAVAYIRDAARADIPACISALERHVDVPVPNRDNDDFVYGHADALRLLQQLNARVVTAPEGDTGRQNANNLHAPPGLSPRELEDLRGALTTLTHHADARVRACAGALDHALDDAGEP